MTVFTYAHTEDEILEEMSDRDSGVSLYETPEAAQAAIDRWTLDNPKSGWIGAKVFSITIRDISTDVLLASPRSVV